MLYFKEVAIQCFFLKIVIRFSYTWEIPEGEFSPVSLQLVSLLFLVEMGSVVGVFQVFCLFYYFLLYGRLFWEN